MGRPSRRAPEFRRPAFRMVRRAHQMHPCATLNDAAVTTKAGNCNPGPLTPLLPRSFTGQSRGLCHLTMSAIPAPSSAAPAMRPMRSPPGATFSTRTRKAMAATQSRFITPATNRSDMSIQQQPTQ